MKTKHTPGPWKAHLNVLGAVIPGHIIKMDDPDEIHRPIASLWEGGGIKGKPEQIANAHLIAASPELLEALKQATKLLSMVLSEDINDPESELGKPNKAFKRLIAKAQGAI